MRNRKQISRATWEVIIVPGVVKLVIPENMPSLNAWKNWHWAKQGKYKKYLTDSVAILYAKAKKPEPLKKTKIQVVHYFPERRKRDEDNYTPKFLADALKQAGFIEDDNSDMLTWLSPVFAVDRKNYRTEVFLYADTGEAGANAE